MRAPLESLPLFAPVETRTLARKADPSTSKEAAIAIADKLTELQQRVFAAFVEHGAMTGKTAENLPEFEDCAPSTVRKRITELARSRRLAPTEAIADGCRVYAVKESQRA